MRIRYIERHVEVARPTNLTAAGEGHRTLLRLMGNEVQTAYDGLAAIEATERFRPDLVLLDIGMPKLNRYDACRCIRPEKWGKESVLIALIG